MECFTHEGRVAVGSCRACLKGVCRACAVDLGRGLACRDRCEQAARDLIATLEQSVRYQAVSSGILAHSRGLWLTLGGVTGLVGVFVIVFGLGLPQYQEIGFLGLPFLALSVAALRMLRRARTS